MYMTMASVASENVTFNMAPWYLDGPMVSGEIRELSDEELECIGGGAPSNAETAGIFGSAGFGAVLGRSAFTGGRIGATLGGFAGPAGALLGGIAGAAFGIGIVFVSRSLF